MKVSVICTVRNERKALPELLASLERQTRQPEEVVVSDGGSNDGTLELLRTYPGPLPLRLVECGGGTIAQGRNAAIRVATGDIMAVTDAGVQLDPNWLAELARPFQQEQSTQAVAGFFRSDPHSVFEMALGATVLPALEEIRPATFLPSSRSVAFTRRSWERAGGYPEWLDYCEDLVFDLRLRELGVAFCWAPGALAHFRPRASLRAFFIQYFRYARGDGKAGLWPRRHTIRYAAYAFAAVAVPLGAQYPLLWPALAAGAVAHLYRPYRRLSPLLGGLSLGERLAAIAWAPLIRMTGDVAKMLGYPLGLLWRWRRPSRGAAPARE
ncbi:MAG: glycosyltransferase [Chloroflexi bacterium]|nr:glycosyltransferase [Chloroflexota bacterium]